MCLPLSPAGNSQAPREPAGPSSCFPHAGAFGVSQRCLPGRLLAHGEEGTPWLPEAPGPAGLSQEPLETKQRPRFSPRAPGGVFQPPLTLALSPRGPGRRPPASSVLSGPSSRHTHHAFPTAPRGRAVAPHTLCPLGSPRGCGRSLHPRPPGLGVWGEDGDLPSREAAHTAGAPAALSASRGDPPGN